MIASIFILSSVVAISTPSAPQPAGQTAQPPLPAPTFSVTVVATTQLPGVEVPIGLIPAPVQRGTARDIEASGALDVADFMSRRMNGVFVNDIQNNSFQADLNYRGYTASPLLGTPQGLSVYMDGVRLNQPFGDVVSWDLIPRIAISTVTLMPGSNPLFGLNTLGGAIALQTKSGLSAPGTTIQTTYGSDVRRAVDFEHGGRTASSAFHWYVAGSLFAEDGWRDDSPSDVRQFFGKIGWQREGHDLNVGVSHADNSLTGNGLQDFQLLGNAYDSIYTKPDTTDNRSTLVNLTSKMRLDSRTSLQAEAYFRDIATGTLNGDVNEESLDQALYQPNAAERAALAAAGYGMVPASGLDATNTPFPSLRCIANVLLEDEPAEKCNGLINRTSTGQRSGGAFVQLTRRGTIASRENIFTAGAGFDRSSVGFAQSTELGYLNPDRSVTGLNAFGDGVTGGEIDGEPYDTRVDLDGDVATWSVFAADTLPLGERASLSVSGRYTRSSIENRDRILPGGGPGSLDGDHAFGRFNPAAGVTIDLTRSVNLFAGYSEGSRAPTSIELGCADPEQPCKLPNAMAGDPPLEQVVTRTFETGARGTHGSLTWNAGFFSATNRDDILFVTSEQTGFGYFRNFGETRRQGIEIGTRGRIGRFTVGARLHVPERDVPERGDGQRRKQQHERRRGERRAWTRRRDRNRAWRRDAARAAASVQGVCRCGRHVEARARRQRDRDERFLRSRKREQRARAGRCLLPRRGFDRRLRRGQPRRPVPVDAVAAGRRPGQQPVRSAVRDGVAARTCGVHGVRSVHRKAAAADRRRVSRPPDDVSRTWRARQDVGRRSHPLLSRFSGPAACRDPARRRESAGPRPRSSRNP